MSGESLSKNKSLYFELETTRSVISFKELRLIKPKPFNHELVDFIDQEYLISSHTRFEKK